MMTDKSAPVEQVDRDAAEDWRNALYDTLNNVDEAVAELAQDFASHRQPLAARVAELEAENARLREGLKFYADPETYHACGFLFDRPTGGFDDDFGEQHEHGHDDYERSMPGKLARALLGDAK